MYKIGVYGIFCLSLFNNLCAMEENDDKKDLKKSERSFSQSKKSKDKSSKKVRKVKSSNFDPKHLSLVQRDLLVLRFIAAIKKADVEYIEALLEQAEDPRTERVPFSTLKDEYGNTPLHCIVGEIVSEKKKLKNKLFKFMPLGQNQKRRGKILQNIYKLCDKSSSFGDWDVKNHDDETPRSMASALADFDCNE